MSTTGRKMAPDERRARYLAAARRRFVERGYDGTTMDDIVADVGGSKATLYRYFPTKEDLVGGLITEALDRSSADQGGPAIEDMPLREALTRLGRITHDVVVGEPAVAMLRLAMGEVHRFPELAQALWQVGPARSYARFHAFLEQRCDAGELDVPDRQFAAEQFLATIAGHIQLKVAMGIAQAPTDAERAARVASAVETFLARYAVDSRA